MHLSHFYFFMSSLPFFYFLMSSLILLSLPCLYLMLSVNIIGLLCWIWIILIPSFPFGFLFFLMLVVFILITISSRFLYVPPILPIPPSRQHRGQHDKLPPGLPMPYPANFANKVVQLTFLLLIDFPDHLAIPHKFDHICALLVILYTPDDLADQAYFLGYCFFAYIAAMMTVLLVFNPYTFL